MIEKRAQIMRIAYIDCPSGISGDMFLGALLDAGLKLDVLKKELAKLPVRGYELRLSRVKRGHIASSKFDVIIDESRNKKDSSVKDIIGMINRSAIPEGAKRIAVKIYGNLERAESRVHAGGKNVHLHELSDIDSIVDIVGAGIAVNALGIEKIFFSNVTFGEGVTKTRSGLLPVPGPATLELMRGASVMFSGIKHELTTPTGAAIIKTLGEESAPPLMKIENIGYGAGARDFKEIPNTLRIAIGTPGKAYLSDAIYVMETAIDDMSPVLYEGVFKSLFDAGALDVYITPVYMKKQRPGNLLTVVTEKSKLEEIAEVIFSQTTTLGLRFYEAARLKLARSFKKVRTEFGSVDVKIGKSENVIYNTMPEYDAVKRRSKKAGAPMKEVYSSAMKKIYKTLSVAVFLSVLLGAGACLADTAQLKNGEFIKGVIVEEYKDRITLSTFEGEKVFKKSEISRILYDEPERNLMALGDRFKNRGQLYEAYAYYRRAYEINPNFTPARDGMFYVSGFLFRQIGADKISLVRRRQEIEEQFKKAREEELPMEKLADQIGIRLEEAGKNPVVTSVEYGTPAYEAGIRKGDLIVAVWGKLTGYMPLKDVVSLFLQAEIGELRIVVERRYPLVPKKARFMQYSELIDAQFTMKMEGLTAEGVKEGGIAYGAGLRDGDLVVDLDGKPTRYMPLREAVRIVACGKGKPLVFIIDREVVVWKRKKES